MNEDDNRNQRLPVRMKPKRFVELFERESGFILPFIRFAALVSWRLRWILNFELK